MSASTGKVKNCMKGMRPSKIELLAPAGSLDVFATAVNEGADAVYVGAPALNARALAKHFTPEELAAMIDHGHKNGVKVYLAMNSLVKEEEIPDLVKLLTLLEKLSPDALIIQDLGLYYLVKKYFPSFTLHASTLMGAHNSLAVQQFADMKFKRVVLAREVTLAEIKKIHRQCPVELEVFVHGALCFSYSGLCLFSSYLGGKSGLRGRCVQPCRRRYTWAGSGKGHRSGYLFSMNDLDGAQHVHELVRAGVVSLKIEGRMRSASYVGAVVKAYRKVIDAGPDTERVMPEVRDLLEQAMGRKPSQGYFVSPQPMDAISPFHSGNIGRFIGKVTSVQGDRVFVSLQEGIEAGDRVRHHHEKSGERKSFTVKDVFQNDNVQSSGQPQQKVSLVLPGVKAQPGDSLYKVDVRKRRRMESSGSLIKPAKYKKMVAQALRPELARNILKKLAFRPPQAPGRKHRAKQAKKPSRQHVPSLPIWIVGSDLRILEQSVVEKPDRLLITLDKESFAQLQKQKKPLRYLTKTVTWILPRIILEEDVGFYRKVVAELAGNGFRQWMISHIGQLQLFQSTRKKIAGARQFPKGRPIIAGDYTLNILNSLGLRFLKARGVDRVQLAIEADKQSLQKICEQKINSEVGLTVYGRPPLFTARLAPEFFKYNTPLISPRGERLELVKKWGQTVALADKPFSLLSQLSDLKEVGFDFAVVDLSFVTLHKKEMASLRRLMQSKSKGRLHNSLNYFRSLQ